MTMQTKNDRISKIVEPMDSGGCARAASTWPRSARPATAILLALIFLSSLARGQDAQPAAVQEMTIVERGPHHRIIQTPTGGIYTELADNLCYLTTNGTYADSQDLIELVDGGNGGAIARQGPNKVNFAPNINTPTGSIDMLTSDGKHLVSRVLGIALIDAASGSSIMLGNVKDSFGKLVSSNVVVYEDAFDAIAGLTADIRYTYKKGSFEQDVILRTLPKDFSPKAYNMDPATSRLTIWTEFTNPPPADVQTVILRQPADPAEPDFTDQEINFGQVKLGNGKAFSTQEDPSLNADGALPVGKSFEKVGDGSRTCL